MFYKSNLYILFSFNYNFFSNKNSKISNKFKFKNLKNHFDIYNDNFFLSSSDANFFLDNFLIFENFYKRNNLKNFLYYFFFCNKNISSNFFWYNKVAENFLIRNDKKLSNLKKNSIVQKNPKESSSYQVIFQSSLIEKNVLENNKNFNDFFFLRKSKIFNKGRYSRSRQIYRTGVYFCLYINILAIYAIYFLFYRFTFNFGFIWFFFFIGVFSFFFSRFFKYNFFENFKFNLNFFFNWVSSVVYALFIYLKNIFKKISSTISLLI